MTKKKVRPGEKRVELPIAEMVVPAFVPAQPPAPVLVQPIAEVPGESPGPIIVMEPPPDDSGLFDDLDDEASGVVMVVEAHTPAPRPDDGIPALDGELTAAERNEFIALLNKELPLRVRAKQLAKLAMYCDTKRAPVGLRAIQEINAITGMSGEHATEAAPMFQLPPDTAVNVTITKVMK